MAKVLLVEDDNNLREIYEARLQAEGYQIATARDGEEALVVAKQEHPDLVISDVMMPKISGFEMLDILRNTDGLQAVKVIMLTALGQNDDQQRANQLGADRYLVKSQVTLEDIVRVAHELLGDAPAAAAPSAPAADSPTPTVTDVPVATPPADPPAAEPPTEAAEAAEATADAESTAQESAAVDAQIENFVSGASSEAPAPETVAAPEPAPEPNPTPTEPTPAEAAASDDKLLADAVNNLVQSTAEPAPAAAPAEPATPEPAPTPEPPTERAGGTRVITPIDASDQPKADLNALVAQEAAKQAAQIVNDVTPPAAQAAPASSTPDPVPTAEPTAPADPTDPNDPRNLAL